MYYERKFAEAMFLITGLFACLFMIVLLTAPVKAAEEKPKLETLFTNAHIFDGKSDKLATNRRVLIAACMRVA